jgi:N-acetylglucosamine kinase-like BadF-type ATPase
MVQAKPENPVIMTIDAGGTSVRIRTQCGDSRVHEDYILPALPDGLPPTFHASDPLPSIVVAGITKVSRPGVFDAWISLLSSAFPLANCIVVPDYELAAAAALRTSHSVMLLAGTGSLACAFDGSHLIRIGGHGWEYGDEGSGTFLTTEIIRRCIRVLDGMLSSTPFLVNVITASKTSNAADFAGWARARAVLDGRGFLVPMLSKAALEGDIDAINFLHGAGGWLARLAHTACKRTSPAATTINVQAVGGLWDAGDIVADSTIKALGKWYETVSFDRFTGSHLDGGIVLASHRISPGT